jgi:hypothetical protein
MQFMQLGPMNGTTLYDDYVARGKMLPEIPFRERHGQEKIWFSHPHFSREESQTFLTAAFAQDYRVNGPSYLRLMDTTLRGLEYTRASADPLVRRRSGDLEKLAGLMRHFLTASKLSSENVATTALVANLGKRFDALLGPASFKEKLTNAAVAALCRTQGLRNGLFSDVRQPPTRVHRYHMVNASAAARLNAPRPQVASLDPA